MTEFVSIAIGQGLETLVSAEDVERVQGQRWYAICPNRRKWYAARQDRVGGKARTTYLHRVILGAQAGEIVDHVNGDGLDNRRENLRIANATQNGANKRCPLGKSGYRGVHQTGTGWRAQFDAYHVRHRSKRFERAEDAAREYDRLAIEQFGEFAVLNFPPEREAA